MPSLNSELESPLTDGVGKARTKCRKIERASKQLPLALCIGEPAGIGPDITLQAWLRRKHIEPLQFYVVGSAEILEERARALRVEVPILTIKDPTSVRDVFERALPVFDLNLSLDSLRIGHATPQSSRLVVDAIKVAVEHVKGKQAGALVTNPIVKKVLYDAGFEFPGHTEFLSHLANRHWGGTHRSVMALMCDELRVVPVTAHMPLSKVPKSISVDLIVNTAQTLVAALRSDFSILEPRLAVAGLNPHAGEDGALGHEDRAVIVPAINTLRIAGINVIGPVAADALFHAAVRSTYDAVLAMYHDQALIPIKTLAFDRAVNVTLGLPFVRTSPDHGAALDIAGTGTASPSSLIQSLLLAARIAEQRSMVTS